MEAQRRERFAPFFVSFLYAQFAFIIRMNLGFA